MALRRSARAAWAHFRTHESLVVLRAVQGSCRQFASDADLKKTALYEFHKQQGGKMVPFAGWSMPIQYQDSIIDSSNWCRSNASVFDVSHMCGLTLQGKDAIAFLESLVVGDIQRLEDGTGSLSVMTNSNGGIIDDTVITKVSPTEVYMVLNAGCRDKDLEHITAQHAKYSGDVTITVHDDRSLLALQGPKAVDVLQPLVQTDLSKVYFGNFRQGLSIAGVGDCFLTRTGYTGEDGFELSIPSSNVLKVAETLVSDDRVRMTGLGARDSLRLEAGLCLYGNDLNEETTPIEASLKWTIGKRRQEKFDFIGGDAIKQQIKDGIKRRRVGILSVGAPARAGAPITLPDGQQVGEMTSGAYSPNLKKNVGMGYVNKPYDKIGTELKVVVRGKAATASVAKMPFIPTTYYKG
eukprot:jgi/Ulvmu1/4880/UM020_0166.1